MIERHQPMPKWILIVSGLVALMEVMVGLILAFSPASVVDGLDLNAKGIDYVIYMWAARQFALGIIFGYATLKRSIPMLTIAYIFFFVMFIGDLLIGFSQKNNSMIISAIVMCLISAVLLYFINKKK
jgi:hypothetical protein